jgi:peptidoglycan hydrolase-like protein with peptidoglycan-binding domain
MLAWFVEQYPGLARSGGIYNCRSIRGSSAKSVHSEGRAIDIMFPVIAGKASWAGHNAVEKLGPVAERLGVTMMIFDRRFWSQRAPSGAVYRGVHPHVDHLHLELSRQAAESLTIEQIRKAAGPPPFDFPPTGRLLRLENPRMRGNDVRAVQRVVGADQDGIYGPTTARLVSTWQKRNGITADGVVGPLTWARMGI